jgi:hypothetical protein
MNDDNDAHVPATTPAPDTHTISTPRESTAPSENSAGAAPFDPSQPPVFQPAHNEGAPQPSGGRITPIPNTGTRGA